MVPLFAFFSDVYFEKWREATLTKYLYKISFDREKKPEYLERKRLFPRATVDRPLNIGDKVLVKVDVADLTNNINVIGT